MNETQIVRRIAKYLFLTKTEVKETLDFMIDDWTEKLKKGERIYIRKFGSLARVKRKERRLRDIKQVCYTKKQSFRLFFLTLHTGKMITVPEHFTIEFRPSPFLEEKINK